MADDPPEHISSQFHGSWIADKSTPLEGTNKHPQGRLFAPIGGYAGDPWKLAPENWLGQTDTPAHDDPIAWHGSNESALPRSDEYEGRAFDPPDHSDYVDPDYDVYEGEDIHIPEEEEDRSVDSKDRPMGEYGSVVGMHFGSIAAATERDPRPFIHPARIPKETLAQPPAGSFVNTQPGHLIGGPYQVQRTNKEGVPDERWTDEAANFAEKGTDLVESGKTLAYENAVEDRGSTSFRTLPETAQTWAEDVMSSKSPSTGRAASKKYGWTDEHSLRGTPHPALVHLAEQGYDPVVLAESQFPKKGEGVQPELPFGPSEDADIAEMSSYVANSGRAAEIADDRARTAEFQKGTTWTLRKPTD